MPLTETDIKALKPHPERHWWVNDGAGLYLRIACVEVGYLEHSPAEGL